MFEKDAEEISKDIYMHHFDDDVNYPDVLKAITVGVQKGAEFGYNKANEWHKADVPTTPINKVVLGYIKDYNTKKFCLVKWNGEWWYDARTWNDKVKLIAWKEIVLPKESE